MTDTMKNAIIAGTVALITGLLAALITLYFKSADLASASRAAEGAQQKVGELLKKVDETKQTVDGRTTTLLKQIEDTKREMHGLTWTSAKLEIGWASFGSGYADLAYAKDGVGIVRLRGRVKSDGQGPHSLLMNLPEGYRPPTHAEAPVACFGDRPCKLIIESTGKVRFEVWNPEWVSLDNVTFSADQKQ